MWANDGRSTIFATSATTRNGMLADWCSSHARRSGTKRASTGKSDDVAAILRWLEAKHGTSGANRSDDGPEFIARAVGFGWPREALGRCTLLQADRGKTATAHRSRAEMKKEFAVREIFRLRISPFAYFRRLFASYSQGFTGTRGAAALLDNSRGRAIRNAQPSRAHSSSISCVSKKTSNRVWPGRIRCRMGSAYGLCFQSLSSGLTTNGNQIFGC